MPNLTNPGTLEWKIGEVRITRVVEVEAPGLTFVLPDATPENLNSIEWLAPHFVNEERQALASVQALVIESKGTRIIVDTCIGNDKALPIRRWSNRSGPFLQDLAASGHPHEQINVVVCTHLHMDHVGWNTSLVNGRWVPTFANARYLFGGIEWDHWNRTREGWTNSIIQQSIEPILEAGLTDLVESDHRVTDEVWLEATPGHTPGHVAVRISSGGREAVITGDLMHHPCQIARPEWASTADVDPKAAGRTRADFVERYADTGTLVFGTHFAAPTAGRVVRDRDGFRFDATWQGGLLPTS
jgi:glyoxylase-like metal-dependent hydrolase (beta-lactamase superfamily II)